MEKVCTIICGAPCKKFPAERVGGFVIAADRGLDYALANGITPDIAVGDFDSAQTDVPKDIECIRVSPIKDDTDTILAANTAVERGFSKLRFLCALGGRLDHSIANIQMLCHLKKRGIQAELYGDNEECFLLENEQRSIAKFNGYLSVFAVSETAVVSESGVKYPIDRYTMKNTFPIGVSNEITAPAAVITAHQGLALVIIQREE